nr:MAG TPA: Minor capsid protein [Caudoviricetes sp.]
MKQDIGLKKLGQMHIKMSTDCMDINVSFDRLARYMSASQRALDNQILTDMVDYIPMETGNLTRQTLAINRENVGSGELVLDATDYARYLYHRKLMIDPETGSAWARPQTIKIMTDQDLEYSRAAHGKAGSHWFERAKEERKRTWLKVARQAAGKR